MEKLRTIIEAEETETVAMNKQLQDVGAAIQLMEQVADAFASSYV